MSDGETSNSKSGNDTDSSGGTTINKQKPNKLRIQACDLEVEAESNDESVEEMMEYLSPEMESLMRHHLAGEYEVIEEEDLFAQIFGGNR